MTLRRNNRIIGYLVLIFLTLSMFESCKVKHKLIEKTETIDTSKTITADSTKLVKSASQIIKTTDSTRKTSEFKTDAKSKSYTEIEINFGDSTIKGLPLDTSGNGIKEGIVNRILQGAKNVKIKIWDYQHKKTEGGSDEQKSLKTEDTKTDATDSTSVKKSDVESKSEKTTSKVDKTKDSSSSVNWVGWVVGFLAVAFAIFILYKFFK